MAGINAGFLVPTGSATIHYVPKPAGVQVHSATSTGNDRGEPMKVGMAVDDDEVQVGSLDEVRQRRDAAAKRPIINPTPVPPPVDTAPPTPVPTRQGTPVAVDSVPPTKKKFAVTTEEVEDQGAVPVAHISRPASVSVKIEDAASVQRQISQLDPLKGAPPPKPIRIASAPQGEDIRATGPGGSTGDVSETRSGEELGELLPDAASSGMPVPTPIVGGEPGFAWDMKRHWRTRLREALGYVNQPKVLEQILAVEQPNVARHIRSDIERHQSAK
ncbi:MAG: hypothetical protein Q8P59_01545, partial [Dehalococcoidia bacterium]|nr:hypothetical protein [Dehalococcoidia bacterium]